MDPLARLSNLNTRGRELAVIRLKKDWTPTIPPERCALTFGLAKANSNQSRSKNQWSLTSGSSVRPGRKRICSFTNPSASKSSRLTWGFNHGNRLALYALVGIRIINATTRITLPKTPGRSTFSTSLPIFVLKIFWTPFE